MSVLPFERIASFLSFMAASVVLASAVKIEMQIFFHDALEDSGIVLQAKTPQGIGERILVITEKSS